MIFVIEGSLLVHQLPSPGDSRLTLQTLVLDYTKAKLVLYPTELRPDAREALGFYLGQYLDLLKRAGHHAFHSLPSSDDERRVTIDYREISSVGVINDVDIEVFGSSVKQINTRLSSIW